MCDALHASGEIGLSAVCSPPSEQTIRDEEALSGIF
jgi:hypothetical protein